MDYKVIFDEPMQTLSGAQISHILAHCDFEVHLILVAEKVEGSREPWYNLYYSGNGKKAVIVTQHGARKKYSNLKNAIDWGRKVGFHKSACFIDYETAYADAIPS